MVKSYSLPIMASILKAELISIKLARNYIAEQDADTYLLWTDLPNAMISIENRNVKNKLVQRIHEMCHKVIER